MKKKLFIVYSLLTLLMAAMSIMTGVWWNNPGPQEAISAGFLAWQLAYAKLCPTLLYLLFTLFNIWIQYSNRIISRQIIHPWVSCRCSLYTFLLLLPLTMTAAEALGVYLYVKLLNKGFVFQGFFYLMGAGLLPATWFQINSLKWCFFVRKYVLLRERRVRNILTRLEQQDQQQMLRRNNRNSAQVVIQRLESETDLIEVNEANQEIYKELTCSICISDFTQGDVIRKLNCKHYFHHECIKLWVVRQQICPNCKVNAFTGIYEQPTPE